MTYIHLVLQQRSNHKHHRGTPDHNPVTPGGPESCRPGRTLHRYFDMLDEMGISIYAAREQGSKIQDNFYWYWNKSPISSVINHTQHDGSNQATNTQKGGRFDDISQFYLLDAASISGGKSG
jgi:hypothetical protein